MQAETLLPVKNFPLSMPSSFLFGDRVLLIQSRLALQPCLSLPGAGVTVYHTCGYGKGLNELLQVFFSPALQLTHHLLIHSFPPSFPPSLLNPEHFCLF